MAAEFRQSTVMMITNNYTPYSGGVVSSLQTTSAQLRAFGYRVIIVTLDFLGQPDTELDVERISCPLRFRYKGTYIAVPWRSYKQLCALCSTYKPDIIHIHHPFLLGADGVAVGCELGIPVVFTYHTMYEQYLHYVPLPPVVTRPIIKALVKDVSKRVDAIIVPTKSILSYIEKDGIFGAEVIPSGILPCFVPPSVIKPKCRGQVCSLITVSRFVVEKNIPFLLDVMARLGPEYHLTLIGYGFYQKYLESYAFERLSLLRDRIHFIERPEKDVIRQWYEKADLFLFASQTETQGIVLAEAMAWGVPVVALRGSGVVDIVCHAVNGYIVDTVDEMAATVMYVMSKEASDHYCALQQEAFKTGTLFYPEKSARMLIDLYSRLCRTKGKKA